MMQMIVNRFLIATAVTWQLAMPVQAQTASLPAGVVATVNGTPITQAEVDAALHASQQPDTPQLRQAIKSQLISRMLIQQAAEKASYGSKPEVQTAIQIAKSNAEAQWYLKDSAMLEPETNAQILARYDAVQTAMQVAKSNSEVQLYLHDNVKPEPVTDAQVKARYDEIVASMGRAEYKPRLIMVKDATTAEAVLVELKAGKSFDELARQYSIAPSRDFGGELPWSSFKTPAAEGKTHELPFQVAQALEKLPVSGVTPKPLPLNGVWVIVKLDAKRPTEIPLFDQEQAGIRLQLHALALEKARDEFIGGLLKGATIQTGTDPK